MSQETLLFPFYDWENQGHHLFADSQRKKGFLCSVFLKVTSHGAPLRDQSFKSFPSQPRLSVSSSREVEFLSFRSPDSCQTQSVFVPYLPEPLSVMLSPARVPRTHSATWSFTFHRLTFAPWAHSPGMQTLNVPSLWPLGSPAASVTHTHTHTHTHTLYINRCNYFHLPQEN